jgi:hypothetical protein
VITKERLNWQAVLALLLLTGVLAFTKFHWGVVRTGRYQDLLVLGLLAMLLSLDRSRDEWSRLHGRVLRWTAVLLPAYVLLQVVPLPMAALRLLSPAKAEAMDALGPVGAKDELRFVERFPHWRLPVLPARLWLHGDFSSSVHTHVAFSRQALAGHLALSRHCGTRSGSGTLAVFRGNGGADSMASLYQTLQILSVTLFEKTPILCALQASDVEANFAENVNQLILFDF